MRLRHRHAVAIGLAVCAAKPAWAQRVEIEEMRQNFRQCSAVADGTQRLSCFDALASKLLPPMFQGSRTEELPQFTIERPTLLRYQSDGPIFVMYLKNEKGDVVHNLHIGGGGESSFLIQKPGVYNLQVSGTDSWRIWVEPQAAPGR